MIVMPAVSANYVETFNRPLAFEHIRQAPIFVCNICYLNVVLKVSLLIKAADKKPIIVSFCFEMDNLNRL